MVLQLQFCLPQMLGAVFWVGSCLCLVDMRSCSREFEFQLLHDDHVHSESKHTEVFIEFSNPCSRVKVLRSVNDVNNLFENEKKNVFLLV